jgi:hypothetical protein
MDEKSPFLSATVGTKPSNVTDSQPLVIGKEKCPAVTVVEMRKDNRADPAVESEALGSA